MKYFAQMIDKGGGDIGEDPLSSDEMVVSSKRKSLKRKRGSNGSFV